MANSISIKGDVTVSKLAVPKHYFYKPQEDITTYELALIVPIFSLRVTDYTQAMRSIEALPDHAKRHFEEMG